MSSSPLSFIIMKMKNEYGETDAKQFNFLMKYQRKTTTISSSFKRLFLERK